MNGDIKFEWIASGQKLSKFCEALAKKPLIAVDSEFVRTRTFYPQLGIIQLFDGQDVAIIDPLAIDDFSSFTALLKNPKIIKLFFAPEEDLTLFYYELKVKVASIIDVQALAKSLQFSKISFDAVIKEVLGVSLDKSDEIRRQNWKKRPLDNAALQYAAADVFYLYPLFHALESQFTQVQQMREQWIAQQNSLAELVYQRFADDYIAYQANKYRNRVHADLLNWRYLVAKKLNRAQNFVIDKKIIYELSSQKIHSAQELRRYLTPAQFRRWGSEIMKIITRQSDTRAESISFKTTSEDKI